LWSTSAAGPVTDFGIAKNRRVQRLGAPAGAAVLYVPGQYLGADVSRSRSVISSASWRISASAARSRLDAATAYEPLNKRLPTPTAARGAAAWICHHTRTRRSNAHWRRTRRTDRRSATL
jgi:hypothetical protein